MFYTAAYAAMNVGAFAVVSHFANAGERYVTLEDYAGLGRRSPVLAAMLTIFLLSLIGIPMTGGFFAKFYVFSAALQAQPDRLVIIGVHQQRDGGLLLPARYRGDVHARAARRRSPVTPISTGLGFALGLSLAATIFPRAFTQIPCSNTRLYPSDCCTDLALSRSLTFAVGISALINLSLGSWSTAASNSRMRWSSTSAAFSSSTG